MSSALVRLARRAAQIGAAAACSQPLGPSVAAGLRQGLHQPPAEAWTRCVWAPLRPRWQAPPPPGAAQPDATAHARPAPARTATAVLSGVRISPKKLNLVAALVRGLSVEEALAQLSLVPKVGARVTEKVLSSASANAVHNHGLDAARLRVRTAVVSKGSFLRRIKFHARGKTGVMHHPKAHLSIVLEEVPAGVAKRLSKRVAAKVKPQTPAWMRHRERRPARAKRVAAMVAGLRAAA